MLGMFKTSKTSFSQLEIKCCHPKPTLQRMSGRCHSTDSLWHYSTLSSETRPRLPRSAQLNENGNSQGAAANGHVAASACPRSQATSHRKGCRTCWTIRLGWCRTGKVHQSWQALSPKRLLSSTGQHCLGCSKILVPTQGQTKLRSTDSRVLRNICLPTRVRKMRGCCYSSSRAVASRIKGCPRIRHRSNPLRRKMQSPGPRAGRRRRSMLKRLVRRALLQSAS